MVPKPYTVWIDRDQCRLPQEGEKGCLLHLGRDMGAGKVSASLTNSVPEGLPLFSPIRGDKLSFDPDCYCGEGVPADKNGMCTGPKALQNRLGEWNEWYVDIHNKKCKKHIKKVMKRRILQAAKKGCDGVDPDNVDEVSKSREKSDGC